MKNREVLNKMNMYDLLCRLNAGIRNEAICIIDALGECKQSTYCMINDCDKCTCEKCIADWLNEESAIPVYERKTI